MKKTWYYLSIVFALYSIPGNMLSQEIDSSMVLIYSMDMEELMNVKITTAGKKAEKVSEIPASVVILTREDIKSNGYSSLAEILSNIPGMFIINDYYFPMGTMGVRGFWPGSDGRNIMVMVNGVNQVNDITSVYILNDIAVPVEAIDRIEIVRGPMSVIYGSGAFYGAINIFTNETYKSEISASAGSLESGKFFGRVAGSQGDLNFSVNASVYNTHGIDQPVSKMVSDTSVLKNYGVPNNYTTGGRLENNQKYMSISTKYKQFTFDFSFNDVSGEGFYLMPSPYDGTNSHAYNTNALIDYKNELSKNITIEAKSVYSLNRLYSKYDYLFEDFYGFQQHETNALELELDAFIRISKELNITTGLYNRSILNAYNMFDIPSFGASTSHQYLFLKKGDKISTRAAFVQTNYQLFYGLQFTAGLRLEQMPEYNIGQLVGDSTMTYFPTSSYKYKEDKVAVIPRFAAIWSINEKNIVKFMYGQATNRPSFFQNIANNFDPNVPALQPEWITTYELNYISFFSDKLMLNSSLFYNTLNNLISRISVLDDQHNYKNWFGNAGKMTTMGTEISIKANIVKSIKVEVSGTYQKTKDLRKTFEKIKVAYSPEFLGYFKISYNLFQGLKLAMFGNYVGEMLPFYDETIVNPDNTYGARIGDKVNSYLLLGANMRMENLFNKKYFIDFKIENLLNKEVRYPTTSNNNWANKGTLGAGRLYMFSLGKSF